MIQRILVLLYGTVAYLLSLAIFLYLAGFIGGFLTPTQLDGPLEGSLATAFLVNLGLLLLFAVQHSVMSRPWFKQWWTQFIPQPIERSTYLLFTNVVVIAWFAFWQPLGGTLWKVTNETGQSILYALYACGWLIVLSMTFLINHFDLFGLRQVWLYFRGRPYTSLTFVTPGPYRVVRHPLYIGWMITFWATPYMTIGHFLFALILTIYMVVAAIYEEYDLVKHFGKRYQAYQEQVSMFVPWLRWIRVKSAL